MIYEPLHIGVIILTFLVLVISSYLDIKTKHIPNWITLPTILVGLGISFFLNWQTALWIVGILITIFLISSTGLLGGMGDVKLFMGMIALTQCNFLPSLLISIAGFILFFLIVYPHTALLSLANAFSHISFMTGIALKTTNLANKFKIKKQEKHKLPYAPFLCFGYIVWFSWQVITCVVV